LDIQVNNHFFLNMRMLRWAEAFSLFVFPSLTYQPDRRCRSGEKVGAIRPTSLLDIGSWTLDIAVNARFFVQIAWKKIVSSGQCPISNVE
jgi:hypothetical protein